MVFLHGLELMGNKAVVFALQQFKGIGPARSKVICNDALVYKECRMKDLTIGQLEHIRKSLAEILEKEKFETLKALKLSKTASQIIPK